MAQENYPRLGESCNFGIWKFRVKLILEEKGVNPSTNEEVFIVCHGCGKHGHVIKNCDKKRGSYTHRYANRGRSSSRSSRGYQGTSRFRSFSSQRGMRQHESYSSNSAQTDDEHQDVISFTAEEKSEKKKELYRHVEVEQEAEEPMYTSEDNESKEKDDDDKCEEIIREKQDDENIQGIEEYRTKSGRQCSAESLLSTDILVAQLLRHQQPALPDRAQHYFLLHSHTSTSYYGTTTHLVHYQILQHLTSTQKTSWPRRQALSLSMTFSLVLLAQSLVLVTPH
ncbi:hypothetical protein ACJJTC_015904 [Scirpophaga incertulas]